MISVVIDRRTWYRGKGGACSRLLLDNGMRCCIGFLGTQIGIKDETMREEADFSAIMPCRQARPFEDDHNDTLNRAYTINDDETLTDSQREEALIETGKEMGVNFIFAN